MPKKNEISIVIEYRDSNNQLYCFNQDFSFADWKDDPDAAMEDVRTAMSELTISGGAPDA